ncbi:MAG: hypothetical protein AAB262_11485, partial [Elusimicrobiota bacterium]
VTVWLVSTHDVTNREAGDPTLVRTWPSVMPVESIRNFSNVISPPAPQEKADKPSNAPPTKTAIIFRMVFSFLSAALFKELLSSQRTISAAVLVDHVYGLFKTSNKTISLRQWPHASFQEIYIGL